MAELERIMEEKLIKQLTCGESQWTYRPDIRDEAALWDNFRRKLELNNIALLDGHSITDSEMRQIKDFIMDTASSPFKAGLWLSGENGVAQIPLVREDASLGTVYLMAINNREIAGGHSCYEVINQYTSAKADVLDRSRRFDVTLLINGLPLIHVELKNQDHPFMDAFRQIQKYGVQGHFRGLFGMVQMFVVSNGSNTRYIAADMPGRLNEQFLTKWVDVNNNSVEDYLDFAKAVLSVPMAHNMIGKYSVLDAAKKKVILLRPYQIHAIEAVKESSRSRVSGFIWHTTGSGKTLTSYTVTKNLLDIPSVDKAVFLIDRKALDEQTTMDFQSYAENDYIQIDETNDTKDLERKLTNDDRQAIVTTIQKLQLVIKKCHAYKKTKQMQKLENKLRRLNIAFVVDECHRTVSPEMKQKIEQFFARSLWYGFTGTPIFAENKRSAKGDLARTTKQLYGKCLHEYTIKEAIKDKAVLGFQIEFASALSDDELCSLAEKLDIMPLAKARALPRLELETVVMNRYEQSTGKVFYDNDEHKNAVIDYIINRCEGKFALNAGEGNTYEAILTCSSIEQAQRYYELIRKFVAEGRVSEWIKQKLPDFPKAAITYTVSENEDGSMVNQQKMREALGDYNAMFGTHFTMESGLSAYNADLNKRLSRKQDRFKRRSEQLDIVIVVDRLLTGFDAPCLSMLFVDRQPLSSQGIVQAFSRTNRLFNARKRYGQIVIFQWPAVYKKAVDDALFLYSNGGEGDVTAPSWEEACERLSKAAQKLSNIVSSPDDVDDLTDIADKQNFAKAYQAFDKALSDIQVYSQWDSCILEKLCRVNYNEIKDYTGKYKNVVDELKQNKENGNDGGIPISVDVEYEIESVQTATVNYRYLMALIQSYLPEEDVLIAPVIEDEKVDEYIKNLGMNNPRLADIINGVWLNIKSDPIKYKGVQVSQLIADKIEQAVDDKLKQFADKWCISLGDLKFAAYNYRADDKLAVDMNFEKFKQSNRDVSVKNKLQYKKMVKNQAAEMIVQEITPLLYGEKIE